MLDGEIVIVDAQGRSSFQKLQRATGKATITGFAYDVLSRRLQPRSESTQALERTPEESGGIEFARRHPL